ncbi:surfeit locus protein 6 homolog [Ostrinia furnacalis]|uniref:surfeit locus protein 6 homolog n=1 Tax=Ostrinia furnacalis TaxID=93504 RepID=UPI001040844E|nr:surfeit locus protein 6 homolog [Ostrinia furnacalis]
MSVKKKSLKMKEIKVSLGKEIKFLKNVFSVLNIPMHSRVENDNLDIEIIHEPKDENKEVRKRARNITELEEKLQKLKTQNNFSFKNKLVKKSLSSKLNKKIKKRERLNKNQTNAQEKIDKANHSQIKTEEVEKKNVNVAKPVFNTDGKLVFSKFDFANIGHKAKVQKSQKDPKKILDNLKEQEQKIRELEESGNSKAKELKEKIAWKNVLQKAEGQKVKDDPNLLKKSIKKMEQKKKQSKKKWENRIQSVEQKKMESQKKRKENISKKKKEKKSKIVKAAVKRGRVVL